MQRIKQISYFLIVFIFLTAISACNTTKYLDSGEAFLSKNTIILNKKPKIKEKNALFYELETLYKQRPNDNFFNLPWISKRYFWYRNQELSDTTKYKKWVLRQFAEKPAVFDDAKAYETAETMEFYLQNRGWFNAEVYHVKNRKNKEGKQVDVTYFVNPKERYLIDTVNFISEDEKVEEILNNIQSDSKLKKEKPVDGRTYEQEVSRISKHLRNNGYYDFYPRYVSPLTGDSMEHRVKIDIEVLVPNNDKKHQTYELGNVTVYPQLFLSDSIRFYTDTIIDGVTFKLPNGEDFLVKPRVLLRNIFMKNGDLFAQSAKDRTNAALGKLGVYKIINIVERPDFEQSNVLNVDIRLTPRKALEFGGDIDVNTSSTTLLGGRFFGAGAGLLIKDRNFFNGAELLVINSNLNFDFDVSQFDNIDSLVNTLDFKIQADVYLPKFVDYLGLWKALNRLNWAGDAFYGRLKEKSSTRLSLSYNYVDRFGFYRLNSLSGSFGYEIPQTNTSRYSITHFGLNFFSPIIEDGLLPILDSNPFFARTFDERQLFTGVLLRNFEYTYTSPINRKGENFSFTGGLEFSGAEVLAVNEIYNAFAADDVVFEIKGKEEPIAFSQYTILEADGRMYKQVSQTQQFVFRLYAGIGIPFGNSIDVPYVKQFYTGGPYSIRAWRARELGPGGYIDPATQGPMANALVFSQTGNFKLETNAEYRFNMFDLFGFEWDGAFFLDIGNVWTLKEDEDRPLSKLSWNPEYEPGTTFKIQDNLFNQLAVGSGFGTRVDFLYFIFRLDIGVPLRNPYPTYILGPTGEPTSEATHWRNFGDLRIRDLTFNIDLGYPF